MQNAGMKAKKAVKTQPKEDEDFNDSELFPAGGGETAGDPAQVSCGRSAIPGGYRQ